MATTANLTGNVANFSHEQVEFEEEPVPILQKLFSAYIFLLVAIAIPTQLFVIRAILRRDQLKTPIHRILLQLAVIDLFGIFWNAVNYWFTHFGNWFFAWEYSCIFFQFPCYVIETAGIFFCIFIGFMLFTKHLTYLFVNLVSGAIWIISTIIMRDLAFNTAHRTEWETEKYKCIAEIGNQDYLELTIEAVRSGLIVAILVILPLLHKVVRGQFWLRSETNDMLLSMILWQVLLSSGSAVIIIETNLRDDYIDRYHLFYFFYFFLLLASVYRPFLYVWCCRHFRNEFKELRVIALVQPETFLLRNEGGA